MNLKNETQLKGPVCIVYAKAIAIKIKIEPNICVGFSFSPSNDQAATAATTGSIITTIEAFELGNFCKPAKNKVSGAIVETMAMPMIIDH